MIFFSFCIENISNLNFFYVPSTEVTQCKIQLQEQFNKVPTAIKGTGSYHFYIFVPDSTSRILVFHLLHSTEKEQKNLEKRRKTWKRVVLNKGQISISSFNDFEVAAIVHCDVFPSDCSVIFLNYFDFYKILNFLKIEKILFLKPI